MSPVTRSTGSTAGRTAQNSPFSSTKHSRPTSRGRRSSTAIVTVPSAVRSFQLNFTLGARHHEIVGALEDRLSRRGFRRKKLGEFRHFCFLYVVGGCAFREAGRVRNARGA